MIIPHILQFPSLLLIPIIPSPIIPLLILRPQPEKEHCTHHTTHKQHCETSAVPCFVPRCLHGNEDIRGDNSARITEADLESGCYGALIVAAHVLCCVRGVEMWRNRSGRTLFNHTQVTGCVIYPPVVIKKQAIYFTPTLTFS